MATIKFQDPSHYRQHSAVPEEDHVFKKWLTDVQLKQDGGNNVIPVALFGAGRAGSIHLINLLNNPRVELLYIVEEDQTRWSSLQKYWNLKNTKLISAEQAATVYNDQKVRAVIITTPTPTHEGIVARALSHNKAVFCEKPIAENIEKARCCFEKAQQVGQPLLTAFNRRFDPAYSSVRERVRRGEVGHVAIIKTCSRDSPSPDVDYLKVSGGIFHDTAVHDIDMILWILGEYPIAVSVAASANVPQIKEIGDFDTVVIVLTFPSGTIGVIDLSRYSSYGYDQRLEVFGHKGMIKVDNQQPIQSVETTYRLDRQTCPMFYSFASRYHTAYMKEMEHFLNVVEGKEKLMVEYHDVLAVNKIASACGEAATTGKTLQIDWTNEKQRIC